MPRVVDMFCIPTRNPPAAHLLKTLEQGRQTLVRGLNNETEISLPFPVIVSPVAKAIISELIPCSPATLLTQARRCVEQQSWL